MIYHCIPSNEDIPFNKDTSFSKFKENFEVLGPCREGFGGIAAKGEDGQRKQDETGNKTNKYKYMCVYIYIYIYIHTWFPGYSPLLLCLPLRSTDL